MADFSTALSVTLGFEGGYSDDPKDPGGETNHGITMATFLLTAHPLLGIEPTSDNLKGLTPAQAGLIYRPKYWNVVQGDAIEHQELANCVFDFYVTSGTHASTLLQTILNQMETKPPLVLDGSIGPACIKALAPLPLDEVYRQFREGRIAYYQSLSAKYPTFIKGWLNRANAFPEVQTAVAAK